LAEGFVINLSAISFRIRAVAPLIVAAITNGLGVPLGMNPTHPEFLDPDPSDRPIASDVLLREEPDEDGEEEEDDDKKNEDDHNGDDGYSE